MCICVQDALENTLDPRDLPLHLSTKSFGSVARFLVSSLLRPLSTNSLSCKQTCGFVLLRARAVAYARAQSRDVFGRCGSWPWHTIPVSRSSPPYSPAALSGVSLDPNARAVIPVGRSSGNLWIESRAVGHLGETSSLCLPE